MYTVSSGWNRLVRQSGIRVSKAELYFGDPNTPIYRNLKVADFSVTADRNAAVRRTGTLQVADLSLVETLKSDLSPIDPYGIEIKIYAGVKAYTAATPEYVPLGVFQVEELSWQEGDGTVTFELQDRSQLLRRNTPAAPLAPAEGSGAQAFITGIITDLVPDAAVTVDAELDDFLFPAGTTYEGDYLQVVSDVASLMGAEYYFDVDGDFQLKTIPEVPFLMVAGGEDWRIDEGHNGVLIGASRRKSRKDTYNQVVVTGGPRPTAQEGVFEEPLTVVVQDTDANSPTYISGPFGIATLRVERQELIQFSDLTNYASSLLSNSKTLSRSLGLSQIMNPALHEGDIILLKLLDNTSELHVVDSITYSQDWSSSIETRAQRVS